MHGIGGTFAVVKTKYGQDFPNCLTRCGYEKCKELRFEQYGNVCFYLSYIYILSYIPMYIPCIFYVYIIGMVVAAPRR